MRSLKAISALAVLLAATAACAAPAAITGFAGYVKARPAPSTMTGTEVLPLVQSGTTTALPLSGLAAYVAKGVTPASIGAQPAIGFTPLNRAGDTMTGSLHLPIPLSATNDDTAAPTSFVGIAVANLKAYLLGTLQQNYTLQVPTAAGLRALVGFPGVTVHRSGFYAAADGGTGDYLFNAAACPTDDGGSCLNAPSGSWRLDWGTMPAATALLFGARCDGATEDTAAEQAGLNAATAARVSFEVAPAGRVCRSDQIVYTTNAHILINGMFKTFGRQNAIANKFAGTLSGVSDDHILIEGSGTIDNGQPSQKAGGACLYNYGSTQYLTVRGITVQNCGYFPVNIVGGIGGPGGGTKPAVHVYLSYVTAHMTSNMNSFQFAQGCDDCWGDHVTIDGTTDDFAFAFYAGNITNSGLTHSRISGGAHGIGVLSDGAAGGQTSPASTNILIEGDEVSDNDGCGIWVQGTSTNSSGPGLKQKAIRIIGNDSHGNNRGHHAYWGGECILDGSGVTSMGNIFHDDGAPNADGSASTVPTAGILLYPVNPNSTQGSDNFSSIGDTAYNEGVGGVGVGAVINQGNTQASFLGFKAYDTQATHTMAQGFAGTCDAGCTILGSKIDAQSVVSPFGGLTILGTATVAENGPYGNTTQGDYAMNGNVVVRGIIATQTMPSSCSGLGKGTLYNNGDGVARFCP